MKILLALSVLLATLCCCQTREARTVPRGEIASMIDEAASEADGNQDSVSNDTGLVSIDTISGIVMRTCFREYKDKFLLYFYEDIDGGIDTVKYSQGYGIIEFTNLKDGRRDSLSINIDLIEQLYKNDSVDYQIYKYQFLNFELESVHGDTIRFRIYCCQPESDIFINLYMNLNKEYVDFFEVYFPLDSEYESIDTTQISQPQPVSDVFGVQAKRFEWMRNWPN